MNTCFSFSSIISRAKQTRQQLTPAINTLANHLIVIFAFSVSFLIDVRRTSLFLVLVLFLIRGNYISHISKSLRDPVILAFSLYFLAYILWLPGTDDWVYARKVTHDASFLLFPMLFSTFIDPRFVPRMVWALFLGMAVSLLWGYGIFLETLPPNVHDGFHGTPDNPSPVWNPNPWAFMLALTVAAWYAQFSSIKNYPWIKWAGILLSLLAIVILAIIAKIVGWVLLLVFSCYIAFVRFRKQKGYLLAITLVILPLAATTVYLASNNVRQEVKRTVSETALLWQEKQFSGSVGWRAAFWYYSRDALRESFWTGLGTGDDKSTLINSIQKGGSSLSHSAGKLEHVHNQYLSSLLQFGITGLVLFLNIIIQLLRYQTDNHKSRLTLQFTGITIAVYSLSDIFVIGLGSLLLTVILVPLNLKQYFVENVAFSPITIQQLFTYISVVLIFAGLSLLS